MELLVDVNLSTRREGCAAGANNLWIDFMLVLAVLLESVEILAVFLANVADEPRS
jgi:hypothetical protein